MWRIILAVAVVALVVLVAYCRQGSDFITDTDPFLSEYVPTPDGGHEAIAQRAENFARKHGMKLHYVPGHFQQTEFSISVTREDLNIATGNVLLKDRTWVTATARGEPSRAQRVEVDEFMCLVMLYGCGKSAAAS